MPSSKPPCPSCARCASGWTRTATPPWRRPGATKRLERPQPSGQRHLSLRKDEVLVQFAADRLHVCKILQEPAVVIAVLPPVELALEIVIAGRAVLVAAGLAAMLDHLLHP